MLALEIDDILPDRLDELDKDIQNKIKDSRCCHCGEVYGGGRLLMYVICSNEELLWWHTVEENKLVQKTKVFHKHPCEL